MKQVEVICSDAGLELQATRLLERYSDRSFSFADAVSFSIMENHGIEEAFTSLIPGKCNDVISQATEVTVFQNIFGRLIPRYTI
ncbi:MAG: hypothetical protein SCJ94_11480 [Bacillota bacterium]|nr:hypothetical protein [Bacillota bacterium]